ncbi:hypothetical protein Pmani_005728 [Petrolisthes manimaculis]|uniref:Uncharacterized protein n=1 Tax=Petrolisthes manimaculis TaxID=1843537 RepID=A0AAE1ULX0_9EUCA|nr:hypothetical protein Pmani_005728 [Petrolisthes manimaculis]
MSLFRLDKWQSLTVNTHSMTQQCVVVTILMVMTAMVVKGVVVEKVFDPTASYSEGSENCSLLVKDIPSLSFLYPSDTNTTDSTPSEGTPSQTQAPCHTETQLTKLLIKPLSPFSVDNPTQSPSSETPDLTTSQCNVTPPTTEITSTSTHVTQPDKVTKLSSVSSTNIIQSPPTKPPGPPSPPPLPIPTLLDLITSSVDILSPPSTDTTRITPQPLIITPLTPHPLGNMKVNPTPHQQVPQQHIISPAVTTTQATTLQPDPELQLLPSVFSTSPTTMSTHFPTTTINPVSSPSNPSSASRLDSLDEVLGELEMLLGRTVPLLFQPEMAQLFNKSYFERVKSANHEMGDKILQEPLPPTDEEGALKKNETTCVLRDIEERLTQLQQVVAVLLSALPRSLMDLQEVALNSEVGIYFFRPEEKAVLDVSSCRQCFAVDHRGDCRQLFFCKAGQTVADRRRLTQEDLLKLYMG